jgi:hypothetical protein
MARPAGTPRSFLSFVNYRPKTPKSGQLSNTSGSLLKGSSGGTIIVDKIILCESSNNATTFTLRLVPSGGADDATNDIYQQVSLAARETQVIEGPIYIVGAEDLRGLASVANRINYKIFYREEI